jgi:hypothetical protein
MVQKLRPFAIDSRIENFLGGVEAIRFLLAIPPKLFARLPLGFLLLETGMFGFSI